MRLKPSASWGNNATCARREECERHGIKSGVDEREALECGVFDVALQFPIHSVHFIGPYQERNLFCPIPKRSLTPGNQLKLPSLFTERILTVCAGAEIIPAG
jgi:hypothetical protein